jgi:acyl-CoA oxidase
MATVFAKLIIGETDYGVMRSLFHCAILTVKFYKVTIGDCGLKMGLNGVDNGTISFENVTIPKENMLDRFLR